MYNKKRTFSPHDDQTIFETQRLYNNLHGQFDPLVTEMSRLYDFTIALLQWDKDIREKLKNAGRPVLSYNFIVNIINTIFAIVHDNAKKGKATPRTGGDNQLAQVVTQTLDFYLYHAGFAKAQRRVWIDKIISGLGVFYVGWKYEGTTDNNGKLIIEAVDPRELMYEPCYNDPLWTETSYLMRKHQMSLEEILNQYALNDDEMYSEIMSEAKNFFEQDSGKRDKWISKKLKALFNAVYETATGSYSTFTNVLQWWDPQTGKFDVLELHEKRTERVLLIDDANRQKQLDITEPYWGEYRVLNENKEPDGYTFEPEIIERIKERYQIQGDAKTNLMPKRFVTAVIPTFNLKVNEQAYPFQSDYYVYIPEQCYDYHADPLKIHSVLSDLVDPQADFNKSKSLILELLGRYSNNGWLMDENAIIGVEEDWTSGRIAPYRRVRSGYINQIKPEQHQVISPDLIRFPLETQQIMQTISNTLGQEISGSRQQEVKSGKHFIAKEQRQAKSFTYILNNRDQTLRAVTEMALSYIQHFVTTQQVIRITQDVRPGQKEPEEVVVNQSKFSIQNGEIAEQVINDLDAYKFDVIIEDTPFSSSVSEERYAKLGDVFNASLSVDPRKADAVLPILIAEGMPEIADKVLAAWEKLDQPNPQQQQFEQLMIQIQQIMAKLGIEEKKEDITGKKLDNIEKGQRIKMNAKENILGQLQNKKNGGQPKREYQSN